MCGCHDRRCTQACHCKCHVGYRYLLPAVTPHDDEPVAALFQSYDQAYMAGMTPMRPVPVDEENADD